MTSKPDPQADLALAQRTLTAIECLDGWQSKIFLHSVHDKLTRMAEWIKANNRTTPKITQAIVNMSGGVDKWVNKSVDSRVSKLH